MAFDADQLGDALGAGRTLAPEAVGSQVLLMSAISIVTVLLFNFLRPKNKIIYEPKVKYHVGSKPPPRISSSFFGWLSPLMHTKEPELLDKIGLDAVAFLRFIRLLRWFFAGTTVLTCGVLIPINYLYNRAHVKPRRRDILSMLTIRDVKGPQLYAHVAISYLITFLLIGLVYYHWKQMVRLRHEWFRSPEHIQSFYARTLSIMHVPKKCQSDAGLRTILESVKMPYPVTAVHIGRKVGKLPELIEYHNQTVRDFESLLVKYLKGGRIGRKRPTIRVGGCCGLGGQKKDAIDFYTAKLTRTEAAVQEYRAHIDSHKAEKYGFASLAAVPYAHTAAKMLASKHPKGTTIELAPNPKDIIWENMNKTDAAIARKRLVGFWWLAVLCFFSLIPLFVVAILANIDAFRATGYLKFLDSWSDDSPITFAIVSGVLPPAVAGLFTFFLPRIMRWLSQYMGALTHARLDRAVVARFFAFLVISQLIVFTLIGVVFNSVAEIVAQIGHGQSATTILKSLDKLPGTIHKTYINQTSYWLKWFPMRGFLVVFDLAQILNLLWISIKTRMFGRTPRDIREWTQPSDFEYAIYYANLVSATTYLRVVYKILTQSCFKLFMAAVGLLFAPLAPLLALAAAIVFWMSSWVYKYQLMFVFVSKVETGGRIWNVVINRLLFSAILMQLLMVLTIGLQDKFHSLKWLSTVPPILIIIAFKFYIKHKFGSKFRYYIPTAEEFSEAKVHSARADVRGHRLEHRFGHPSLHSELFTPMLHAKMMPLLREVYKGRISETEQGALKEYGGQKTEVQVVEGIRVAAIQQQDLEYDPVLYQRDRGELDWDRQSMASTNVLSMTEATSSIYSKTPYTPNAGLPAGYGYDTYLATGPTPSPNPSSMPTTPPPQHSRQSTGYFEQQRPLSMPSTVAPNTNTTSWYSEQGPSDEQYLQQNSFVHQQMDMPPPTQAPYMPGPQVQPNMPFGGAGQGPPPPPGPPSGAMPSQYSPYPPQGPYPGYQS
ncbi:hypothetical protein HGRIS_001969 [Hohenbuehelia grisea]|uniref:DUF221-domain-containing protein n=1 Tax=Hohenbuehelia grisea TaxID=104357 RepID=A0ABR3JJ14_9AGAR